jgi:hypothetical protein
MSVDEERNRFATADRWTKPDWTGGWAGGWTKPWDRVAPAAAAAGTGAAALEAAKLTLRLAEQCARAQGLAEGDVLADAVESLDRLLSQLRPTGETTTRARLPADGRYCLGNGALQLELRVDANETGIVSGDLFAAADGEREPMLSFRSAPGFSVSTVTNAFPIVAQHVRGDRSTGRLQLTADESYVECELLLADQMAHLPVGRSIRLTGRRSGELPRELGLELGIEAGLGPSPALTFDGRRITIEGCLQAAGFDVANIGRAEAIPVAPASRWQDGQLHALMASYADEPLDRPAWSLQLLMLGESSTDGLLGVMFDTGSDDLNRLPRQGVAIFRRTIEQHFGENAPRKLIQTAVHELGHALNLAHRFEREVGRANSTSFMNYDWRYLGGGNEERFWREFAFKFDRDELAFLRHGPWDAVIPGGKEFHTVPYWENVEGGYVPYAPEVAGREFTLSMLAPPANVVGEAVLFDYAQPVLLTVKLKNQSGRAMRMPKFILDPKAGFLEIVVKPLSHGQDSPRGGGQAFRPILHRCFDLNVAPQNQTNSPDGSERDLTNLLHNGEEMWNNVSLTFGSDGFTFAAPGDYSVTAVLVLQSPRRPGLRYQSAPMRVRIAHPKTQAEERLALELFRPAVGQFIALGGSDALPAVRDQLTEVRDRIRTDKQRAQVALAAHLTRTIAIDLERPYVRYQGGQHRVLPGAPAKASRELQSLLGLEDYFDPYTQGSIARLRSRLVGGHGPAGTGSGVKRRRGAPKDA